MPMSSIILPFGFSVPCTSQVPDHHNQEQSDSRRRAGPQGDGAFLAPEQAGFASSGGFELHGPIRAHKHEVAEIAAGQVVVVGCLPLARGRGGRPGHFRLNVTGQIGRRNDAIAVEIGKAFEAGEERAGERRVSGPRAAVRNDLVGCPCGQNLASLPGGDTLHVDVT